MFKKCSQIKDFVIQIAHHGNEMKVLLPSLEMDVQLKRLFTLFEQLNPVALAHQHDKATVSTVRYLFDEVISTFPFIRYRLGSRAPIVHCQDFESGLVKIQ